MIDVSLFTPKNHKGAVVHDSMKKWLVALLAALLPCVAGAAGLGRLNVLSALGQPLVAEIELSVSKEELGSLSVRLASPDAYRNANLQYNPALTGSRIAIERRPNGQSFVKITSSRPVAEPFIDLLIELTWASGRLSREYTALLDPPGVPSAPPAPAVSAVPESRPAPAPEAQPQPKAVTAPAASTPVIAAPSAGGKEYGPIQRGETLGKIAKSVMPEGVTLEQMLVALYRSNPDAFIRKNLNLVRTGKVLRVPDREEVAAVARGDAVKEYRTHVADWNAYRQKVADVAGAAPPEGRTAVSGKITTRVEDKAAKGEPKDVVKLSKGEPPGEAGKKGKPRSSAERIRSLEEEAVAREKALTEANSRITQLEKTIQDMKKLAELKSPGMAAAQQQAQQAAAPKPDAKGAAKPEEKKPEAVAKPEPAKPEAKKPEVVAAAKPEAAKPAEAPKPEAAAPAEKPAPDKAEAPKPEATATPAPKPAVEAKPAPKKPVPAPKAKAKEPELMDQVMDALTDPLYLGAGGAVIVVGGLVFWLARRRRSQADAGGEPVAPTLSKAAAAAAGAAAVSADTSAASPTAAATTGDEVDPLAEAEVYIAYGRDGQAEEILKEALSKNPKREDVQLKLLEIYAARKDKAAFGKIAGDFNKLTGGTGDNWIKAAAMGYALDAANPMYAAGKDVVGVAPSAAAGAADVDLDLDLGETTGTATDITLDAGAAAAGTDTGILDLGVGDKVEEPAAATPDFALDVPAAEAPREAAAPAQDANVIDFQIELPKSAAEEPTRAPPPAVAPAGDGGLDFKLDDLSLTLDAKLAPEAAAGGEKDGHWYDVQTKFDLAKAYQEMGDKDGAKEILQEVIKEGDNEQKAQAKTLLDSLG
jgi:pilus assembly protein FimV